MHRPRFTSYLLLLLIVAGAGYAEEEPSDRGPTFPSTPRVWRDATGDYQVEARLVEIHNASVVLATSDGRRITVPIERLSAADRALLAKWRESPAANSLPIVGLRYDNPRKMRARIGVKVTAANGPCSAVVATFPLPMEWPEQRVTILEQDASPEAQRVTNRTLSDGVKQVEFRVPRLNNGQSVHLIYALEIERFRILAPPNPAVFVIPARVDADLRRYLGESPFIETGHPAVQAAADEIQLDSTVSAWEQVQTIYDWTQERVKHGGTKPLKGALQAVVKGDGDCEERTSLFIAMCRLKGVPARSVWVERHTYPEFYLEDPEGQGHWFPCESLGQRSFGSIAQYRLLWQKGDNFRMAQKREPQRYVTPTLSCLLGPNSGQPTLHEVREFTPLP